MIDLALVLVTWNNAEVIEPALQSLLADLAGSDLRHTVWLVDSASQDDTLARVRRGFPTVRVIACERNIGFGAANNRALRSMGFGDPGAADSLPHAVFLLNPDTVTQPGACARLYATLMADESIGLVGARLNYGDGNFQHSAFHFPGLRQIWAELFPTPGAWREGRFNGRYPRQLYEADEPFPIDFALGAAMMLKPEVIQQTKGFDERFFFYCEEVEWAWRIQQRGWRILCEPRARITHLGGGSTSQAAPRSFVQLWRSRLYMYEKIAPPWKQAVARQLIALGMRRRLRSLHAQDADMSAAYREILQLVQA